MGASFKDYDLWKVTYAVTMALWDELETFPAKEFRLVDQIRRATLSIGLNFAEGWGRRSPRDKLHFYTMSFGSNEELKAALLVANGRKYLKQFDLLWKNVESISKMLRNLMGSFGSDSA